MLRSHRSCGTRCTGEDGSVILAITVILVATIAILATLSSVSSGLRLARTDQNRTNAFQLANGGVDQAVYRLDSTTLPTVASGSYVPTVSGGKVIAFTEEVTVGSSRYNLTATATPPGQSTFWTVKSVGTDVSGRQRQAVATVQAQPLFVNGFFTDKTFYLTGEQDTPIAYDSAVCEDPRIASPSAACVLPTPISGSLGTNSTFEGATATTVEFAARWASFNMYGRATQEDADQACDVGNCGTSPKVNAITNRLPIARPKLPLTGVQACPGAGIVSGTVGSPYVIPPGDYLCTDLTLSGVVNVGTTGSGRVRIWIDRDFNAAPGAKVNEGKKSTNLFLYQRPLCSAVSDPAATPCNPNASSSGAVCDAELWGQLYLPALEIDCHGSHQPVFYGAVVAEIHSGTGNHFDFHWDVQSQYAVNDGLYVIKNWRECPPSSSGTC